MISIRTKTVRSHLDPVEGPRLAALEGRRLERWLAACRLMREDVMFLTFTYDPAPYGGDTHPDIAETIFNAARRGKHLSVAMRSLGDLLGRDLKGCWRGKAEFHKRTGIIHFHVLLRGFTFIDWRLLREAWPHGHVKPLKAKRVHAAYIAKYTAKGGGGSIPDFLYDMPAKSLKIWHTSPGFWSILNDCEPDQDHLVDDVNMRFLGVKRVTRFHRVGSQIMDGERPGVNEPRDGETLRERLTRACGIRVSDDEGNAIDCDGVDETTLILVLWKRFGKQHLGKKWGGICFDATIGDARDALRHAAFLLSSMESDKRLDELESYLDRNGATACATSAEWEAGRRHAKRAAGSASLDLISQQVRESTPRYQCGIHPAEWPDDVAPF